jgi:hypothetical protein
MRNTFKPLRFFIYLSTMVILSGCASYYQKQVKVQRKLEKGNVGAALNALPEDKKAAKGRNELLFYLEKGSLAFLNGKNELCLEYLNKADFYIEDQKLDVGKYALSLLTNPNVMDYRPEDHERVMIHYYKSLAYLQLGKNEEARIEARRLNIQLNTLNDKYPKKNRYSVDAFAWVIMGMAYDADQEYNNAFIAYRNAYNAYAETYKPLFGMEAPLQLKKDLIRTAYLGGLSTEGKYYEKECNLKYDKSEPKAEGIVIWNNGLAPIKDQSSLDFVVQKGQGGAIYLQNAALGLSIPYPVNSAEEGSGSIADLNFFRVAIPRYLERRPLFYGASVIMNGENFDLQRAEDINQIAFKTLEDRMLREISSAVVRLAAKKASEYALRQQNGDLGAVLGLINMFSEQADTRNWQSLPHTIHYTRISGQEGNQKITLNTYGSNQRNGKVSQSKDYSITLKENTLKFFVFNTFDSK